MNSIRNNKIMSQRVEYIDTFNTEEFYKKIYQFHDIVRLDSLNTLRNFARS